MTWCLVLGAAGGIGSAVSELLDRRGVTAWGIDRAGVKKRGTSSMKHRAIALDSNGSVRNCLGTLTGRLGTPQAVISCLGSYSRTGLEKYTDGKFEATMHDNFNCLFWALKFLTPLLASNGRGRLVITTSQAAATGGHDPVYAAAKAACGALVKSIAREYGGAGVRCNGVSPGPVDTKAARVAMGRNRVNLYRRQIPIRRITEAREVASLLVYLALDAPDALNGTIFDIDGGLVRR